MTSASERYAALVRLVEQQPFSRVTPPLLLAAGPFFDLAGEELGRNLLLTTADDGIEYCLRPDFTLPIAQAYLDNGLIGTPAAYSYLGPIFRQEESRPAEHVQAGLELLGQTDADQALDQVLSFARWALDAYGIAAPSIRLGGVGLFEAFLEAAGVPPVWRSRIRHRFGNPVALRRLIERLAAPAAAPAGDLEDRESVMQRIADALLSSGLGTSGSRTPAEIADRYLEKQALDAARVPELVVKLLQDYLAVADSAPMALDRIGDMCAAHGFDFEEPLFQVRKHASALAALSPAADVIFDAGFSPRLDYYTGIVFQMTGAGGEILASGGEYDRLLTRLGAPRHVAASGCALWVARLEREAAR